MRRSGETVVLSTTDLSNFRYGRQLSGLDLAAADGKLSRPPFDDPRLDLVFRRGVTR